MPYYHKPTARESILIFGDGDEAVFITYGASHEEGCIFFRFNPTPQMRWKKQIPESHFSENGRWIDKVYKKDLCFQLSGDPDFPLWLILCDYNGLEDTPFMDYFVKCRQLLMRNRDLEKDKKILQSSLDRAKHTLRKIAEHPDENELAKLKHAQMIIDMTPRQQNPFYPEPSMETGG